MLLRVVDGGVLRVGMSGEQPPLNMTARNGEIIGLEVAVVRVIAQSMKVRPEIVQVPFADLLPALEEDRVDVVISGVTITPERSVRVQMLGPYYTSGKCFLTRSKELAGARTPQDLDSGQLTFAVLKDSTSQAFAEENMPNARSVPTATLAAGINRVRSSGVDALITDRETCDFAVLRYPEEGLVASEKTFTVEPMGIAIKSGQQAFGRLLDTYLRSLRDSGTLDRATQFWFKDPSWIKQIR